MMILYWVNRQRHYSQSPLSTNKSTFFSLLYGSMMCLWMNERLVGGSAVAAILKKRKNWSLDDDGAVGLDWIVVGSWLLLQKNVCTHHHLLLHEISHSSQSKSLLIRLSICESKKSRVASFCLHVTYYVVVLTGFVSVGQNFFFQKKVEFSLLLLLPQCEMEIHLKELYLDYADGLGKHFQKVDISTCLRYHQWINLLLGHICFLIFVECDVNEKKCFFLCLWLFV